MVANVGSPAVQNPLVFFESYTDQVMSATYPTNSVSNILDSTPTNQWNYFCWQPPTSKQVGLNNAFPPITLDGTANTPFAYPIIIIPKAGLYQITAEANVGIPRNGTAATPCRDILILGKNYGTNYVKQATPPTGWVNGGNNYPITNRDNGTQSTLVPPTVVLATAHLDANSAEEDGDDHTILSLRTVAYLNVGDDLTLSMNVDQSLNGAKVTLQQPVNSVQIQIASLPGYNGSVQTDASMTVGVNPGYSYSTI